MDEFIHLQQIYFAMKRVFPQLQLCINMFGIKTRLFYTRNYSELFSDFCVIVDILHFVLDLYVNLQVKNVATMSSQFPKVKHFLALRGVLMFTRYVITSILLCFQNWLSCFNFLLLNVFYFKFRTISNFLCFRLNLYISTS